MGSIRSLATGALAASLMLASCAPPRIGSSRPMDAVPLELRVFAAPQNAEMPGGVIAYRCAPAREHAERLERYEISFGDGGVSPSPGLHGYVYASEGWYTITCRASGENAYGWDAVSVLIE